jgi:hypothetical protein
MSENKSKLAFIPFNAINEFMRTEYRLQVIRSTLNGLPDLEDRLRNPVDRLTKKHVSVPGFRNSAKAPVTVKAVGMVKAFEKEPKLVAAILNAWSEVNADLRTAVYKMLVGRGWRVYPLEARRINMPGFLTSWPEGEDYEVLYDEIVSADPDIEHGIDDVSLMVVWIAMRLPVNKVSEEELDELPFTPESESEE